VGMYFPSINFLKSSIIEDSSRANMNSIMRLPLSTFVVLAHSLAKEGLSACCFQVDLSGWGCLTVALRRPSPKQRISHIWRRPVGGIYYHSPLFTMRRSIP
jgi:hypothetical protein